MCIPPPPRVHAINPSQWNPNPDHHLLAVGSGKCVVIVATGTGGEAATEITEALLQASGEQAVRTCPRTGCSVWSGSKCLKWYLCLERF